MQFDLIVDSRFGDDPEKKRDWYQETTIVHQRFNQSSQYSTNYSSWASNQVSSRDSLALLIVDDAILAAHSQDARSSQDYLFQDTEDNCYHRRISSANNALNASATECDRLAWWINPFETAQRHANRPLDFPAARSFVPQPAIEEAMQRHQASTVNHRRRFPFSIQRKLSSFQEEQKNTIQKSIK